LLGFMTTSAVDSVEAVNASIKATAIDLVELDRVLAEYGADTREIRGALKAFVANRIDMVWSEKGSREEPDASDGGRGAERIAAQVRHLVPQTADQRWLHTRAVTLS